MNRTENSRPVHNAVKLQNLLILRFGVRRLLHLHVNGLGKLGRRPDLRFGGGSITHGLLLGLQQFFFKFRFGLLEFSQALAQSAGNSGSFLAPNKRKTITRMAIISGVPSPKIANMFIMEYYSIFNIFFSCRILHNTLHASSEDCRSCFCCSASLLAAKR